MISIVDVLQGDEILEGTVEHDDETHTFKYERDRHTGDIRILTDFIPLPRDEDLDLNIEGGNYYGRFTQTGVWESIPHEEVDDG